MSHLPHHCISGWRQLIVAEYKRARRRDAGHGGHQGYLGRIQARGVCRPGNTHARRSVRVGAPSPTASVVNSTQSEALVALANVTAHSQYKEKAERLPLLPRSASFGGTGGPPVGAKCRNAQEECFTEHVWSQHMCDVLFRSATLSDSTTGLHIQWFFQWHHEMFRVLCKNHVILFLYLISQCRHELGLSASSLLCNC